MAKELQLFYVYTSAVALWLLILIQWARHAKTHSEVPNGLHRTVFMLPILFLGAALLNWISLAYLGYFGGRQWLCQSLIYPVEFAPEFWLLVCLFLIAKGWYIMRRWLAPVEIRTIVILSALLAAVMILNRYMDSGSMIGVVICGSAYMIQVLWIIRQSIDQLQGHIDTIELSLPAADFIGRDDVENKRRIANGRADGQPIHWLLLDDKWQLLEPYVQKAEIIDRSQNIISTYALGTCVNLLMQFFGQAPSEYVSTTFTQLLHMFLVIWIGILLRARRPVEVVVIPPSRHAALARQM
ncbi:uncharacterized protein BJ171DRAFT_518337 [Polychytrium aggregatum]|uniref:uncharacterized protein n=1 Tax=Polychytrium aggregatum TaxID=110093 RepID=UPI0022FE0AAF|nr:uncharacterized protein BJ171DRAFT_518337 [Polychytrium aggregatum]KAI9199424.1 hypothetical protein BJ171DRAFT_518337 [Polychytrium aggregatum]